MKILKERLLDDEEKIEDMKNKMEEMEKKPQLDLWVMEKKFVDDGLKEGSVRDGGKGGIKSIKGYDHKDGPKP